MRNLRDVLAQMIDAVPEETKLNAYQKVYNLVVDLRSIEKSLKYSAPEMYHTWWNQVGTTVNAYFPSDPAKLLPWQKKVVDIFTGEA